MALQAKKEGQSVIRILAEVMTIAIGGYAPRTRIAGERGHR